MLIVRQRRLCFRSFFTVLLVTSVVFVSSFFFLGGGVTFSDWIKGNQRESHHFGGSKSLFGHIPTFGSRSVAGASRMSLTHCWGGPMSLCRTGRAFFGCRCQVCSFHLMGMRAQISLVSF